MRPPTPNVISQGAHGATLAVDHRAVLDPYVYAPEDLTFDSYQQRGSGTLDAGMCLRARGSKGLHQFAHLERTFFTGGTVKKGTRIAKMGYSGYTKPAGPAGTHLHYWIRQTNGTYIYPPNLYTEPFGGGVPAPAKMPAVGSSILITIPRTAFSPGTTAAVGTLPPDTRIVRGYDSKYPYRILVNSASLGNGVAVALYLTNGVIIEGWRTV